jgi:hypothetical protein
MNVASIPSIFRNRLDGFQDGLLSLPPHMTRPMHPSHCVLCRHASRFAMLVVMLAVCLAMESNATSLQPDAHPASESATASDPITRVVRAGPTSVRIETIGIEDPLRVRMLQDWAEEAARASLLPSGRFPLRNATVRISEIDSRSASPVPWGQTLRRDGVFVLLYVRRGASLEALRADWTAVHELAHLRHPYLGDDGRWLAEGLASYAQNTLRARAGLLAQDEAWRRLDAGFRRGEAVGEGPPMAQIGRSRGGTMRVYWVGAAYWLEADLALRRDHGTTLDGVLDRYAQCCLDGEAWVRPERFLAELDRLAGTDLFIALHTRYTQIRDFPSLRDSYRALGIERDGGALKFSGRPDAARLRAAIMSKE